MKRTSNLMTQVLTVNLLLIVAAVAAATLATNPRFELSAKPEAGLVLGLAIALTVAMNVYLLQRRLRPLERLVDEPLVGAPRVQQRAPGLDVGSHRQAS